MSGGNAVTPSIREMRVAWIEWRNGDAPELVADDEFDRFMARVRAEAVREAALSEKLSANALRELQARANRIEGIE